MQYYNTVLKEHPVRVATVAVSGREQQVSKQNGIWDSHGDQ
jgi:hypothetical protein